MADYVDALFESMGGRTPDQAECARAVHDAMQAREEALLQPLLEFLVGRNDVRLIGPRDARSRAPTVGVLAERPGADLAAALAPMGIMAGGGDFYAVRPLQAMGIDPAHGVLRLSFTHYTSQDEVSRLITALDRVL